MWHIRAGDVNHFGGSAGGDDWEEGVGGDEDQSFAVKGFTEYAECKVV